MWCLEWLYWWILSFLFLSFTLHSSIFLWTALHQRIHITKSSLLLQKTPIPNDPKITTIISSSWKFKVSDKSISSIIIVSISHLLSLKLLRCHPQNRKKSTPTKRSRRPRNLNRNGTNTCLNTKNLQNMKFSSISSSLSCGSPSWSCPTSWKAFLPPLLLMDRCSLYCVVQRLRCRHWHHLLWIHVL